MRTLGKVLLMAGALVALPAWAHSGDSAHDKDSYVAREQAQQMFASLKQQGLDIEQVKEALANAKRQESILKLMSRPAEKRLTWGEYRDLFVEEDRISRGVNFWKKHADTLARAEAEYGVPAEVIVAIIGVETRYGRVTGSHRVIDALATLGFDYPPRSEFFLGQLEAYFLMTHEQNIDPLSLKGSYAGAMGYGQFIPSSYRIYAIDFDQDGKTDIWNNPVDAIGSVANYFAEHNWQPGEPVTASVVINSEVQNEWFEGGLKPQRTLQEWSELGVGTPKSFDQQQNGKLLRLMHEDGEHYVMALDNFYTITRYNHSHLYAMAVHTLSQRLKECYEQEAG